MRVDTNKTLSAELLFGNKIVADEFFEIVFGLEIIMFDLTVDQLGQDFFGGIDVTVRGQNQAKLLPNKRRELTEIGDGRCNDEAIGNLDDFARGFITRFFRVAFQHVEIEGTDGRDFAIIIAYLNAIAGVEEFTPVNQGAANQIHQGFFLGDRQGSRNNT